MKSSRIPSLDGARAVAITLVVVFHAMWNRPLPIIWRLDVGLLGVRIFFVISGFLITTLLLEERERAGRISLSQFYFRRAFRILPAAYVYVAAMVLLIPLGMHVMYKQVWPVLFYYADYKVWKMPWIAMAQFWSLSVEEQFYFLWPAVLVLLGTKRARYACAMLLLTAPTFRVLSAMGIWPTYPSFAFESVCDALATGCLLAMLRDELWSVSLYRRMIEGRGVLVLASVATLLTCAGVPTVARFTVGLPLLNISIAMLLDRYMRRPTQGFGRALNWRPLVWLGTISYSLYLWQQPWMYSHLPVIIRIAGAVSCASFSYYLVERPLLRARSRISITLANRAPMATQID